MPDADSVFERMKEARLQTAVRLRETVSQERMAELVSKHLGRVLHTTQWRRYETDREPPLDVITAAASVSGMLEGYIAFGTGERLSPTGARTTAPTEHPDVEVDRAGSRKVTEPKPAEEKRRRA